MLTFSIYLHSCEKWESTVHRLSEARSVSVTTIAFIFKLIFFNFLFKVLKKKYANFFVLQIFSKK